MSVMQLLRIYAAVTLLTAVLFVLLGLSGVFQQWLNTEQRPPMENVALQLSSQWLIDMLAEQLPGVEPTARRWSGRAVFVFLTEWMTRLNPFEPQSLLAHAIPGLSKQEAYLLHPSPHVEPDDKPFDPIPPETAVRPAADKVEQQPPQPNDPPPADRVEQNQRKSVFIYHSHNRESWIPELTHRNIKKPEQAFDESINITLVGKRLASLLAEKGVGADVADDDYPSTVPTFKYTRSYAYSIKTVREAIARNGVYDFYFDLHRDSQGRKKTTIKRNGVDYARIYFIVGSKNPKWRENYEFAKRIHEKMERKFPGLSKSIYAKRSHGNGYYNQTVSPSSSLIEIGGPYNTLEESYRTVGILAEVIAELYRERKGAGGPR